LPNREPPFDRDARTAPAWRPLDPLSPCRAGEL